MISIGWVGSHACAGNTIATALPKQSAATPKALLVVRISLLPLVLLHGRSLRRLGMNSSPLRASYPVRIKSQIPDSPIRGRNRLRLLRTEADFTGHFCSATSTALATQHCNHWIAMTLTRRGSRYCNRPE